MSVDLNDLDRPRSGDVRARGATRKWMFAWFGASVLGVANGVSREALYAEAVGDDGAHLISTGTLLALLSGYLWFLQRRWPLRSRTEALKVGVAWAAMTIAFEFSFGHWVDGDSWSALLENYDLRAGRVWIAVPAAMLVGPEVARRRSSPRPEDARERARGRHAIDMEDQAA